MAAVLYYNGTILTMAGEEPQTVEAVLTENGRIAAAGKLAEIESMPGFDDGATSRRDLAGATMLPAFIDPHSHITAVTQVFGYESLKGTESFEEIAGRLEKYKERTGSRPGDWLIGVGYDHNFLKEKRHPDKFLLDRYFPDDPVMLSHASGHMGVVNSAALARMGLTEDTPDPEGGVIGRLPGTGELTGYLEETAFTSAGKAVPRPSMEQLAKQFQMAQDLYLRRGITTVQDGLTRSDEWKLLKYMADQGELRVDVVSYVDMKSDQKLLGENEKYAGGYRNRLRIGGYKIFLDGSPQGRTAWMTEPYAGDGAYCGYPIYRDAEVEHFFETALREGRQLLVHCNGDAAAEQMIAACRAASERAGIGPGTIRPVMIHAQLVRRDQLERMAGLSMTASFFIAHIYYWGVIHRKNFGEERASLISPANSARLERVNFTFHQDSPVIQPDMLETIWCAVNRIGMDGTVMGREERISPYEALRAVTINAALQYGEEREKGSIEPGKKADLVILDLNPLDVNPIMIKNIRVLGTVKDGETVYKLGG